MFNVLVIFSGCGGILTAPTGEIMSPHYPQDFPPNVVCYYKIRVNPGNIIKLVFVDFEVSKFNYLEVLTKNYQEESKKIFTDIFLK